MSRIRGPMSGSLSAAGLLLAGLAGGACSGIGAPPPRVGPGDPRLPAESDLLVRDLERDSLLVLRLIAAEDGRRVTSSSEGVWEEGVNAPNPAVRAIAHRGMGRLRTTALLARIAGGLEDPEVSVRRDAAMALAMSVALADPASPEVTWALEEIESALAREPDPVGRGELYRALGRVPLSPDDPTALRRREGLLADGVADHTGHDSERDDQGRRWAPSLGAARGAVSLYRQARGRLGADATLTDGLLRLAADPTLPAELRRVALQARIAAGPLPDRERARLLRGDPDAGVRRIAAVLPMGAQPDPPLTEAIRAGLSDPDAGVRLEALRSWVRLAPSDEACAGLMGAFTDPDPRVSLEAIDRAVVPCGEDLQFKDEVVRALSQHAGALPGASGPDLHRAIHALTGLSSLQPEAARPFLNAAATHQSLAPRVYAARAAARIPAIGTLRRLSDDPEPWVREEAILGLRAVEGPAADPWIIAQLSQGDPGLIRAAAALLAGRPPSAPEVPYLLQALAHLTADAGESGRDARLAVLERLEEVGSIWQSDALRPLLEDPDDWVAERTARVLAAWGDTLEARPRLRSALPLPSFADLKRMERVRIVLSLEGGDSLRIRLLPLIAPTNAYRFLRLIEGGALDGRSIHRVVPNFVIQGGSPGANEYSGHGAFTRDEVGIPGHWAGSVGTSTRGYDTGDGQFFVNLVDNLRLDGDYTVFGVLDGGIPAASRVLEGERIDRIRVEDPLRGRP